MKNSRLDLDKSMIENIIELSDGNPGALVAMQKLVNSTIDKDAKILKGLNVLMDLDSAGIYGTDIYVLFNDICHSVVLDVMTLLRGMQLGFVDQVILADACHRQDRSGADTITFDFIASTYWKVKKELPNFNS